MVGEKGSPARREDLAKFVPDAVGLYALNCRMEEAEASETPHMPAHHGLYAEVSKICKL